MFKTNRLYSQIDFQAGRTGWYFLAREGNFGPYESRVAAESMLSEFVTRCISTGNDGGRSKVKSGQVLLSLEPIAASDAYVFDPDKTRKGLDRF